MRILVLLVSFLLVCNQAFAEEEGKRGFVMDVSVSGFFSPDVKQAKVTSVVPHSNAEKLGIKVGDQLISVFDCKIPGCPAKEAKKMMTKAKGEILSLTFVREDNSEYSVELTLE